MAFNNKIISCSFYTLGQLDGLSCLHAETQDERVAWIWYVLIIPYSREKKQWWTKWCLKFFFWMCFMLIPPTFHWLKQSHGQAWSIFLLGRVSKYFWTVIQFTTCCLQVLILIYFYSIIIWTMSIYAAYSS